MPIYEYKCSDCGHHLEAIQKLSDESLKDCPACSRPTLKRLISAAGFQLKGNGWYATDFKNNGKKKDSNGSGQSESSPSGSDAGGDGAKKTHTCTGGCAH